MGVYSLWAALLNKEWESSGQCCTSAVLNNREQFHHHTLDTVLCSTCIVLPKMYLFLLFVTAPLKQNVFSSATTGCHIQNCIRSKESIDFLVLWNSNDRTKAIDTDGKWTFEKYLTVIANINSNILIYISSQTASLRSNIMKGILVKIPYKTWPKLNLKLCGFIIKHLEVEGQSIAVLKSPYSSLITAQ